MRTLKEEIEYQKQKGFYHNTIEHDTLLAWLWKQVAMEDEIRRLRDDVAKWRSLAESNAKLAEICQNRYERSDRLGI